MKGANVPAGKQKDQKQSNEKSNDEKTQTYAIIENFQKTFAPARGWSRCCRSQHAITEARDGLEILRGARLVPLPRRGAAGHPGADRAHRGPAHGLGAVPHAGRAVRADVGDGLR